MTALVQLSEVTRIAALVLMVLVGGSLWCSATASAETIGIWDIRSTPVSAAMLSGTASRVENQWLNVADVAISPNTALSGSSVLDDGIANLTPDALFQLTFAGDSAKNNPGSDLVLFDARYDAGSYAISTSFDGFATELLILDTSFVDTGETRDYFIGEFPGSFTAEIWGFGIDLSLLGIPDGIAVRDIRVRPLNGGADLIGVGSLNVPEPSSLGLLVLGLTAFGWFRSKRAAAS